MREQYDEDDERSKVYERIKQWIEKQRQENIETNIWATKNSCKIVRKMIGKGLKCW